MEVEEVFEAANGCWSMLYLRMFNKNKASVSFRSTYTLNFNNSSFILSNSKNYETTFNHFLLHFLRYLCNFCPNTCSQEAILMKVLHLGVVTLPGRIIFTQGELGWIQCLAITLLPCGCLWWPYHGSLEVHNEKCDTSPLWQRCCSGCEHRVQSSPTLKMLSMNCENSTPKVKQSLSQADFMNKCWSTRSINSIA